MAKAGAGEWVDASAGLLSSGFTRKRCIGRYGKIEQQTLSFQLQAVTGLRAIALQIITSASDIRARVTWDDGTPYFIGTIRPSASLKADSILRPVSLEIIDDSYFLEYTYSGSALSLYGSSSSYKIICSTPAESLVHWLVAKCMIGSSATAAFSSSDIQIASDVDQAKTSEGLNLEPGDTIKDNLDAMLYEYGLQYRFDESGILHVMKSAVDSLSSITDLVTDSLMKNSLTMKRSDSSSDGSKVTYQTVQSGICRVAEHSISDPKYADSKTLGRGYEWLNSGEVWPPSDGSDEVTLSSTDLNSSARTLLRIDLSTMTAVSEHEYVSGFLGIGKSSTDCSRYMTQDVSDSSIWHLYMVAHADKVLVRKFYANAKCWYLDSGRSSSVVYPGKSPIEHDAVYVHSLTDADALARRLKAQVDSGELEYTCTMLKASGLALAPGQALHLVSATVGIDTYVRVVSVTDAGDSCEDLLSTVVMEGIEALEDVQGDPSSSVTGYISSLGSAALALTPDIATIDQGDEVSEVTVKASGDAVELLGGTLTWYLNGTLTANTGNAYSIPIASLATGTNAVTVDCAIDGVDFGSEPLTAGCSIVLASFTPIIQYVIGTDPDAYPVETIYFWGEGQIMWGSQEVGSAGIGYDTPPAIVEGEYIWVLISTDGGSTWSYSRFTGESGISVTLGKSSVSIPCGEDGAVADAMSIEIPVNSFSGSTRVPCTIAVGSLPSGMTLTSVTPGTASSAGSVALSVASGATLDSASSGQIVLTVATTAGGGSSTAVSFSWAKSLAGQDAASATLGLDTVPIPCTARGLTDGSMQMTIPVYASRGSSKAAGAIAVSGLPDGMSLSSKTDPTASADGQAILAVASGSSLGGQDSGSVAIAVTIGVQTFVKAFSWVKQMAGADGKLDQIGLLATDGSSASYPALQIAGYDIEGAATEDLGFILYKGVQCWMTSALGTFAKTGDGVIFIDVSAATESSPAAVSFGRLALKTVTVNGAAASKLVIQDFETGTELVGYDSVDSSKVMIGEFSISGTDDAYGNAFEHAELKTPAPVWAFVNSDFTKILARSGSGSTAEAEAWAEALGVSQYYQTLAVSKLLAGVIFSHEIIITDGGSIHSEYYNADGTVNEASSADSGFFTGASGQIKGYNGEFDGFISVDHAFVKKGVFRRDRFYPERF